MNFAKKNIEVSATFSGDKITRLQLKCYPISFNNRKKIEEEIEAKYKFIEKDLNFQKRVYEAEGFYIIVHNPETLLIDVQFQPVIEGKVDKLQLKRTILFTIIGVFLSALFIILYFTYKTSVILHVLTSIIAISYAMYQFIFLYIRKLLMDKSRKIALCIVIPFIYLLLIIFLSFFYFGMMGFLPDPNLANILGDILMVIIYISPSFHLLLLLLAGLSYA